VTAHLARDREALNLRKREQALAYPSRDPESHIDGRVEGHALEVDTDEAQVLMMRPVPNPHPDSRRRGNGVDHSGQ
jgi:hypothetical protein